MKLKVPVNSFESAVLQIDAGAEEIYMGLSSGIFQRMSFSARAQVMCNNTNSTLSKIDFKKICEYAHNHNVKVNFTANCQHISNSENDFYKKEYIKYVYTGVELGADALIVSDIGNIIMIKSNNIDTPIIAGSYFSAFNHETVAFLEEAGVSRVCLPDHVTIEEIKSIKKHSNIEIEVFIGYGCSNIAGSCNFCHNNGETKHVGVTCRGLYKDDFGDVSNFLDACTDCAICSIPNLIEAQVDSLKLTGRELDCIENSEITRMYKNAIEMYYRGSIVNKKDIISSIGWWEKNMCNDRCKYKATLLTNSFI